MLVNIGPSSLKILLIAKLVIPVKTVDNEYGTLKRRPVSADIRGRNPIGDQSQVRFCSTLSPVRDAPRQTFH